jgi:CDP-paratose 2-epimerase
LAWFCIAAALGKPITICGDGRQVGNALFIDALIQAHELASEQMDCVAGGTFNICGGPENTLSLDELIELLKTLSVRRIPLRYNNWRPGDQKICVEDISLARAMFSWIPAVGPRQGAEKLNSWVVKNRALLETLRFRRGRAAWHIKKEITISMC